MRLLLTLLAALALASAAPVPLESEADAASKGGKAGCGPATGACAFGSRPGACDGVSTQCADGGCAAHAGDLKVRWLVYVWGKRGEWPRGGARLLV